MSPSVKQNVSAKHRSPHRYPMGRTLVSLFGAPVAWVMQMSLSEPIAAYACYPRQVPLSAPLWVELPLILAVISLVCLAAGLLSGYVAWTSWRQIRNGSVVITKAANGHPDAGVDEGQTRFLTMLGMMSSSLFIVAIVFTCCAIFLVPPCSAWI
ncbi:hypothetical protein [Nitrosovibrio tenuis]|uniref:Uncharacterized protein n=1 Tax=Nitrosovibrio tenuis TaxID=1233 RepID=A0A1H7N254_9PROT|nr:hypothetical protein [Nitrosovibrio tenuis]SEL16957.1 hypothetical protein SAMN05216387_10612 [Nitrosovibrio tenuis]